jgi:hypothetical protein
MDNHILEHSFNLIDERQGELVFDGYGGEVDHIHIEVNTARTTWELSETDAKALHTYLTAWIKARQAIALYEAQREMTGDPPTADEVAAMRKVWKQDSDKRL